MWSIFLFIYLFFFKCKTPLSNAYRQKTSAQPVAGSSIPSGWSAHHLHSPPSGRITHTACPSLQQQCMQFQHWQLWRGRLSTWEHTFHSGANMNELDHITETLQMQKTEQITNSGAMRRSTHNPSGSAAIVKATMATLPNASCQIRRITPLNYNMCIYLISCGMWYRGFLPFFS